MSHREDAAAIVELAIAEDVGEGDWTTLWTVPEDVRGTALIVAKGEGVISGSEVARLTFEMIDPRLEVEMVSPDGSVVSAGDTVMRVHGPARSILTGERTALNFLQRLSGVATLTRAYVEQVEGTAATILDTRKTTPGMRLLEKAAVLAGGGGNHRVGLFDMVLIKENHIRTAGGIGPAVRAVFEQNDGGLAVEVEVTNLEEAEAAAACGVDRILLDNMDVDLLREAVAIVRRHDPEIEIEASGGVSLSTVRAIAGTGVDFISVGALTHSPPALDLSLLFQAPQNG